MEETWRENICRLYNVKSEDIKIFDKKYEYDIYMDKECVDICNAMNSLKGIETRESCCGHGKSEFRIYFKVSDFKGLFFFVRCIDRRYWKYGNDWRVELCVGDSFSDNYLPIIYIFTSVNVLGEEAYNQIRDLIENMNYHLNNKNFLDFYNLTNDLLI